MKDLEGFKPRVEALDFEADMKANFINKDRDMVTLKYGEEVICIAGINHLRIGVAEAWLIPSDSINKCKFAFFKTIKRLVDYVNYNMEIHRFILAIDCSWMGGDRWARALGFKFESIAKAYDFNRQDHAIYTRIV